MDSNPSSGVVQSQVHENDHEHTPNNVGSQPVAHSEEKPHEMKLFMNKVKAKAKKFTDTFKKHDQNVPDDHHDLDKDEETEEDQEVHEAPIHESEVVRSATPRSGQGDNLGKSGVSFGGTTTVKGEEPHHEPRVVGVSPTTEINQQNITTDPAKTFVGEEESGQPEVYLKEEDPHASRSKPEAYTPPRHQTKVTDLTGAGTGEIDIAPVEKSFARMNVQDQDELKPSPEPKFLPNVAEPQSPPARSHNQFVPDHSSATKTQDPSAESHDQYMPELSSVTKTQYPSAGSHDHFEPDLSAAVKTQYPSDGSHDQFALESVSTGTNSYNENSEPAEQTFNTNRTKVEEQPSYESVEKPSSQSSYTADKILSGTSAADRAVSPEHSVDSELGYGEKGDREDKVTIHDEQKKSGDASNMSGSGPEYGKDIDHSVTEKLASPVYGKVAGVGSEVKSKLSGTGTGTGTGTNTAAAGTETENVVKEQNKGASVKDYLAEKLKPGEEDKALSEVISEALHKRKEEPKKVSGDEDRDVSEVISDDTHKREEETVEKEDEKSEKVSEESSVNSPGKGVVDRLKDAYGSWFGKSVENQSTPQGDEGLSKSKDSGSEVEQVSKAEGEKRLQE